jgi:hypothetical protein
MEIETQRSVLNGIFTSYPRDGSSHGKCIKFCGVSIQSISEIILVQSLKLTVMGDVRIGKAPRILE